MPNHSCQVFKRFSPNALKIGMSQTAGAYRYRVEFFILRLSRFRMVLNVTADNELCQPFILLNNTTQTKIQHNENHSKPYNIPSNKTKNVHIYAYHSSRLHCIATVQYKFWNRVGILPFSSYIYIYFGSDIKRFCRMNIEN